LIDYYYGVGVIWQVPRGHVWLEGDNLENSSDSRSYGPVPYGLLRSRVIYKVSNFAFWYMHHVLKKVCSILGITVTNISKCYCHLSLMV